MDYAFGESMFEKAEVYASTVNDLYNRDILDASTIVLSQLAIECYLCSIIESATGKDVDSVYGKGRVPHNLDILYSDAHSYSERGFSFDRNLKSSLKSAFLDYKASRFPKPNQYVVVDEEAIKADVSLIDDVKEIAEEYLKNNTKQM